ncbi:MAG: hypothetical protein ACHQHN_19075 [Sphingobacteriales bacterium]
MYTSRTGLTLGFHGTDESIVQDVLNGKSELKKKDNDYDWLGHGIYFWDNSPSRALDWSIELSKRKGSKIKKPAVIGAILDLGYCLDLLDYKNLELVKFGYTLLEATLTKSKTPMPQNRGGEDLRLRELDCAAIQSLHKSMKDSGEKEFDSARGVFWEGDPLYLNAGFREKNHIQICIRNLDCIKGYFLPLKRITT